MTRSPLSRLSGVLLIGTLATLALIGAAKQKQVHPASGQGGPIVIAVVADHYAANEEAEFDHDVANFFAHGLLADPDFYQAMAADFRIETFFEPVAAGVESNYDFTIGAGPSLCSVQSSAATAQKLRDVVSGIAPRHIVVIGNHPYNLGCTDGEWTYVAVDAVGSDVLQHEFGHALGELYDEWAPSPGKPGSFQDVLDARLNCWDIAATAPWYGTPNVTNRPGCAFFSQLIHAHDDCRMGATHHEKFCPVCRGHMIDAFDYLRNAVQNPELTNPDVTNPNITNPNQQNPPQADLSSRRDLRIVNAVFELQPPAKPVAPAAPRSIFQLLVSFDPTKRTLSAKKGYFTTAQYLPKHRRASGKYVYEFSDAKGILEVGVLSPHLFETRSYRGGASQHQVSEPHPADIVLQLPNLVEREVRDPARALTLRIYRLGSAVTTRTITPAVFRDLKDSKQAELVVQLTGDQIRGAL